MTFCFVHAADLHLDTPYQGIGKVSPAVAQAVRDASLDAFDALVQLAIDRAAAFVVLAGDIYDGSDRDLRAQFRFLAGLTRLSDRGIRSFVIHGNHDPLDGWSAIRAWPPGVTIFGSASVEAAVVEANGAQLATVYGISYATREVSENLALRFRRGTNAGVHVGMLHCNVGGDSDHGPYSPCTVDDLRAAGMDYWALGHIHKHHILHAASPWVVYPGNLQGRSPKPSELGAKGAVVVTVDGNSVQAPEFVALDRTRFVRVEVDIQGVIDLLDLQAVLLDQAEALRVEHDGRGLLLRAEISGRGPVHADLGRLGVVDDLLNQLREAAIGTQPFVWWESIRDLTRHDLDRASIRARGDFAAELLHLGEALRANSAALDRFAQVQFESLSHASFARIVAEFALDEDEFASLLSDAEDLVLDRLEV